MGTEKHHKQIEISHKITAMNLTINKYNESIAFVLVSKEVECYIISDGRNFVEQYSQDEGTNTKLPLGNWQILFRLSEATNDDYVKVIAVKKIWPGWIDYEKYLEPCESYAFAVGSYQSLLRANGIHLTPQQDVIFIKNNKQ